MSKGTSQTRTNNRSGEVERRRRRSKDQFVDLPDGTKKRLNKHVRRMTMRELEREDREDRRFTRLG